MKHFIFLCSFLFVINVIDAQSSMDCSWTFEIGITEKPSRIFHLTKSDSIALCGKPDIINKKLIYSAFVLYRCGEPDSLYEGDATCSYTIRQVKDTLVVQQFYGIPNGKNMSVRWQAFYVTKFYFKKGKLFDTTYYQTDLKKYTDAQMSHVISAYKKMKEPLKNDDDFLLMVNRLFWAYVSGSRQAEDCLNRLNIKYGSLDGAIGEEFDELMMTYEDYKQRKNKR